MYNILYIHTHDTGRYTSVYGKQVPTPELRRFAEDAVVFRNAYCASPTCSPSRGALLTGCYPHQNGLMGLAHRGFSIEDRSRHLASFLRGRGYETVLAGVQHEQNMYDYSEQSVLYSSLLGYEKNISYISKEAGTCDKWRADAANAERAAQYLDAYSGGRPFFLSYGMFETHRPYPALPQEEIDLCREDYLEVPRNVYDSKENRGDTARLHYSLKLFDDNFGTVIEALKRNHLYENTIILSTTDHGLANPFSKCTLTDDGMGVSLIMRLPGYEDVNGSVYDGLVSQIDIYPTLCEALGIAPGSWLEGTSLMPVFRGDGKPVREAVYGEINFHTAYEPARCIRTERYKYIRYYDEEWTKYNLSNCDDSVIKDLLVADGWREKDKQTEYLYDLYFDPAEKNNLAESPAYRETLEAMRRRLEAWQRETADSIPAWQPYKGLCKLNRRDTLSPTVTDDDQLDSAMV